jgi:RNA polymerase sigma-70 factor (ECF subfamily)
MPERPPDDADRRFDEEFQRHWLSVFRFALAWTNDWPAAEDLAQDSFARLRVKRATIDWSEPMLPWLLTTTRRLATDRFRRLRRTARLIGGAQPAMPDSDAHVRWLDVQDAMSRLTAVQRSSLVLTAVIGLDTESTADALGTTPGAVRAAVSRARSRLVEA